MKYHILLLEDVLNQGKKGDLIHVAPGFARNFLLPQRKAVLASSSTLKLRERLKKERDEQALKDRAESEKLAAVLQGQMFETVVKVDPDGHMYGSIGAVDIVDLLDKQGHQIHKKHVALQHPIRQIGSHQVTLKLPEGVEVTIGLELKPDREIKKKEEKVVPSEAIAEETPNVESEEKTEKESKKKKRSE